MHESSKRSRSNRLVMAYRQWAAQLEKASPNAPKLVMMDDLADISKDAQIAANSELDWKQEFLYAVEERSSPFSDTELLKIRQSLAFSELLNVLPSRQTVLMCGGILEEVSPSIIQSLSENILELEDEISGPFPTFEMTSIEYAKMFVSKGYDFMHMHIPELGSIPLNIKEMSKNSPFIAQVVTNESGEILCEISTCRPIDSKFTYALIHEMLGHVLNFSELKRNTKIQQSAPHMLCLSLHTHETFFIEAISQLITNFLIMRSSWDFPGRNLLRISELKFRRDQAASHLTMKKILDGDMDAKEGARHHASLVNSAHLISIYEERYLALTSDLFSIKSALTYHPAFEAVAPLLNLEEKTFFEVLGEMISTYFTPLSLKEFVKHKQSK